jgi:hypothetical protein
MVQDDVWNHIAYVSDGTQTRIYLNGALVATINTSGLNVTSARAGFMIGASGTNGSIHQFPGRIDQVKVWNRALNATEVSTSMNALSDAGLSGMVARYDFNEGSGSTIYDRVGSRNLTASGSFAFSDNAAILNDASGKTYQPGFTAWSAISLVHAAPASIEVTTAPSSVKAGIASATGFGLRVLDAYGNLVTDWSRGSWATTSPSLTMTYMSSTTSSPQVSSTVNLTALISTASATAGRGTFSNVVIGGLATTSKQIQFGLAGSQISVSSTVAIVGGAAQQLSFTGGIQPPGSYVAGSTMPAVAVVVSDAFGNTTSEVASVSAAVSSSGVLTGETFSANNSGSQARFTSIITTASATLVSQSALVVSINGIAGSEFTSSLFRNIGRAHV